MAGGAVDRQIKSGSWRGLANMQFAEFDSIEGRLRTQPIRRRRARAVELVHPGLPGADNRWFASQGEARRAALLEASRLGPRSGIIHDSLPTIGLPHYHIADPTGRRISGHFFYGRRPPRQILRRKPLGEFEVGAVDPTLIDQSTRARWLQQMDLAVRTQFGLSGPTLNASQVRFVPSAQFARLIPPAEIPELLLSLFISPSPGTGVRDILRFHHKTDLLEGQRNERLMNNRMRDLQQFIAARMRIGSFQFSVGPNISPFRPSSRSMVITNITPGQIIANTIGGVTSQQPTRAARRVLIQLPAAVQTLVHETCHFYTHDNFNSAVRLRARTRFFRGLRLSEVLTEGMTEHFARQVMRANASSGAGPIDESVYAGFLEMAGRFIATCEEQTARDAYFRGQAAAINRLFRAMELNLEAYPLLVPGFMLT